MAADPRSSHQEAAGICADAPEPGAKIFASGDGPTEGLRVLFQAYRGPTYENVSCLVDVMTYDPAYSAESLGRQRASDATERPDHLPSFVAGLGTTAPAKQYLTESDACGISVPALVLHGRDYRIVSYENGLRLTALISQSRLLVIYRRGQRLQLELAAVFNRIVKDFIAHD